MNIVDREVSQLLDFIKFPKRPSDDMKKWPKANRMAAEAAIKREMDQMPKGSKIVLRRSCCDRRADLSGLPWQLYLFIKIKVP